MLVCLSLVLRALAWTWRVERRGALPAGPAVLALWHGELAALSLLHRDAGLRPLISQSDDGERLTSLLLRWGFSPIRGSSSRGGLQALRGALHALTAGARVVVAVDGPRGPAGVPKRGADALATRAPLWIARVRAKPAVRAPTWDHQLIPLPFARVVVTLRPAEGTTGAALGPLNDAPGATDEGMAPPPLR